MLKAITFVLFATLILSATACAGQGEAKPPATPRVATSTPDSTALQKTMEGRYVSQMSQPLADLVRAQPWFTAATAESVELAKDMLACERQAIARGEKDSVRGMLEFAAQQSWYADGLDARELRALSGLLLAYTESLSDDNAPPIGSTLANTLRYGLFEVLQLPETGEFLLMVSAQDEKAGRMAMDHAVEFIPRVEGLVGAYPYKFLYIEVAPEISGFYAGLSYDQFIAISPEYNDAGTIVHELTHSTLYGSFPLWFEEGLAYFTETHLTSSPAEVQAIFASLLGSSWQNAKIDVRSFTGHSEVNALVEQAGGYVFLKSLFDLHGEDAFFATVRTLRTKTYSDQELVRELVNRGPQDTSAARAALVCQRITGLVRDYCSP